MTATHAPWLMEASVFADTAVVEKTRKPARPAAKPAAPRKRAPAAKPKAAARPRKATASLPAEPATPRAHPGQRRNWFALLSVGLVVVAVVSAAGFLVLRDDAPSGASAEMLASFAGSHDGPVYWAGTIPARKLELTATSAGTFVKYLPLSAAAGDAARTITVATYPLRNAYATATDRAKSAQMTSRETAGGGVVVWKLSRPTSVYLAFPGVPHLVEVYAPDADEARTLALSGRIRPVPSA
jgi:hypothetical protein